MKQLVKLGKLIRKEIKKTLLEIENNNKAIQTIGDLIDTMQDNEEGLDQGLKPSQLIDYDEIVKLAAGQGIKININKLKNLAKANDKEGFLYSGADLISQSIIP